MKKFAHKRKFTEVSQFLIISMRGEDRGHCKYTKNHVKKFHVDIFRKRIF